MNYDALIIVDVQTALVEGGPYNKQNFMENIKKLLHGFRAKGIPVIYIRHDGGSGNELEGKSEGWEIYHEISPLPEEKIIEKRYNSAFKNTELKEYLDSIGAKNIVLCGMQTEYCIDATCKVAFEYGYNVTIPKESATTFDNDFAKGKALSEYYENKIWNNRYARIIDVGDIISNG